MEYKPQPAPKEAPEKYRSLKELMKGAPGFSKASELEAPKKKIEARVLEPKNPNIPDGADARAFRAPYTLTVDDCPYVGASFTGTWTCFCERIVYRAGFPLKPGLKCFDRGHTSCEEFKILRCMGFAGYAENRIPMALRHP